MATKEEQIAQAVRGYGVTPAPSKFVHVTQIVIDNLEGGYYHPNMQAADPKKFAIMGKSGETMYGIDRVAGGKINETTAGKLFWSIIDSKQASTTWKYNYKSEGDTAAMLKCLAATMIYDTYVKLCKQFNLDRNIVDNDDCLLVHWSYACWNGSKHFQNWAKQFNAEVSRQKDLISKGKQKELNYDLLRACALNCRLTDGTKAIRDRADRISGIWKKYFNYTLPTTALATAQKMQKSKLWLWLLLGGVIVGSGIGIYVWRKKTKR